MKTAEQKRTEFLEKAKENQAKFEFIIKLKDQIFSDVNKDQLATIIKNDCQEDWFLLKLIEFAEAYHENLINSISDEMIEEASKEFIPDVKTSTSCDCSYAFIQGADLLKQKLLNK